MTDTTMQIAHWTQAHQSVTKMVADGEISLEINKVVLQHIEGRIKALETTLKALGESEDKPSKKK